MASNKKLKAKIIQEIADLIQKNGIDDTDLKVVYEKYKEDVARSTFYRWAKSLSEKPTRRNINRVRKNYSDRKRKTKLDDHLPIIPSNATIATVGVKTFDFVLEMSKLYKDVELARGKSVKIDEEGNEKVINPKLLLETVKSRRGLIDTRINAQTLLLDMNRLARIHNFIFELVAELAPQVFPEMVRRIEQFEQENGLKI
jgi:hypothetical protein